MVPKEYVQRLRSLGQASGYWRKIRFSVASPAAKSITKCKGPTVAAGFGSGRMGPGGHRSKRPWHHLQLPTTCPVCAILFARSDRSVTQASPDALARCHDPTVGRPQPLQTPVGRELSCGAQRSPSKNDRRCIIQKEVGHDSLRGHNPSRTSNPNAAAMVAALGSV